MLFKPAKTESRRLSPEPQTKNATKQGNQKKESVKVYVPNELLTRDEIMNMLASEVVVRPKSKLLTPSH